MPAIVVVEGELARPAGDDFADRALAIGDTGIFDGERTGPCPAPLMLLLLLLFPAG